MPSEKARTGFNFDLSDEMIPDVLQRELAEDLAREVAEPAAEEAELMPHQSAVLTPEDVIVAVPWYVMQTTEEGAWYRSNVTEKGAGAASALATATGMNTEFILQAMIQGRYDGLLEVKDKESRSRRIPANLRVKPAGRQFVDTIAATKPDQLKRISGYITDYKKQNILLMRNEVGAEQKHLGVKPEVFKRLGDLSIRQLNQHMADLKEQQAELLDCIDSARPGKK